MIMDEHRGLFEDMKKYWTRKERQSHIKNNFFTSYYLAGLSYYALSYPDEALKMYLQNKADSYLDSSTKKVNYPIHVIDQYAIGVFYINMYRLTSMLKYKNVYTDLYQQLMARKDSNDLIPYLDDSPYHYADELGMYVPFLMEYYDETKDSLALEVVNKNVASYMQNGIDSDTHLPFHGYDKETKMKLGSANWGRGIGWYLFALAYCPQINDTLLTDNIDKLPYSQFPMTGYGFDSSTALMFEIYKQSKHPERKVDLSFIKPYIRKEGIVDNFSGDTYAFNDYSHLSGCSELGNGFLLMLISKFCNLK